MTTVQEGLESALESDVSVLYKHSPRCGVSRDALDQIERFARTHPEVPLLTVDVLDQRDLSDRITEALGVRHHSPQVIVLRRGEVVWSATHFKVTAEAIEEAIESSDG